MCGFWLWTFVTIYYDKFLSLSKVLDKYPDISTSVLNHKSYHYFSKGTDLYINVKDTTALCNFQIYSEIWEYLSGNVSNIVTLSTNNDKVNKFIKRKILLSLLWPLKNFIKKRVKIFSYNSSFKLRDYFILSYRLNFNLIPSEIFIWDMEKSANKNLFDRQIRLEIKNLFIKNINRDNDDFYNLCLSLIANNIPLNYLESLESTKKNIKKIFPNSSKAFLSSATQSNDIWNILCAEKLKNGVKIINLQHGGGYGVQSFDNVEDYELSISDIFLSCWSRSKKIKMFYLFIVLKPIL